MIGTKIIVGENESGSAYYEHSICTAVNGLYNSIITKQQALTNPVLYTSISGSNTIDLSEYNGHLAQVYITIDSNAYLVLSGIFTINGSIFVNFYADLCSTKERLSTRLENTSGVYKLSYAYWGDTNKISTSFWTIRIF